jgi:lipoprotein-anchoring transpeptidase ErfK/SrfK
VRVGLGVIGLTVAIATVSPVASDAAVPPLVKPQQELAALFARHTARSAPLRSAPKLRIVASRRPITEEQTVLPVVGHATDATGRRWLRVRLPGRPNGGTGWIERSGTARRTTNMHIVVEIARRRVVVFRSGRAIRTFVAIVGKPSTPTPIGEFFVEEAIALPASAVGAPFALALSARSNVFQEFDGGPGQIALHGLDHIGGTLGTAASHGCVRLSGVALSWLVLRIGPGVPVSIR